MTCIAVPYHLDEYLPDLDLPLAGDATITADLPAGAVLDRMAHLFDAAADAVAAAVERGERPIVVSGDCSTSLATVAGLQRAGLTPSIVWFDAHGDVQTLETTTSGYLGGMPVRFLVGYRPELITARLGLRAIAEDQVVLVDARDLDPAEVDYLARAAIRRASIDQLAELPAGDDAAWPDGPLYVHFDADVIDPADLPGLLYPTPGGRSMSRVGDALRRVLASGRVAALGIACTWRPGHGAGARLREQLAPLLPARRPAM